MPDIRCRYYDDSGKLTDKSHNRERCNYVHPDSRSWDTAPRRRSSYPRPSSSWALDGASIASKSNATAMAQGEKSWGQPSKSDGASTASKSNATAVAQGEKTSGQPSKSSSWADVINNGPQESFGWDTDSTAQNWKGGSWGETNQGEKEKEGGSQVAGSAVATKETNTWSSAGMSRGESTAGTSTRWDTNEEPSSRNNMNKDERINKGNERDVVMRNPSSPPSPINPLPLISSEVSAQRKKPDLPRLDSTVQSGHNQTASWSPISPIQPMTGTPRVPSVRPTFKLPVFDNDESASTPTSSTSPQSYRGCKGRVALFKEVILKMHEAIIYQIMCVHAQAEEARWKRTFPSEIYTRPTPNARSILESHRYRCGDNVVKAKSGRDRALRHLSKLPDFTSSRVKLTEPEKTREMIQAYTTELKEWFEDLELHKRILMVKEDASEAKSNPPTAEVPAETQLPTEETYLHLLLEKETWNWKELKDALALLQTAVENTTEHVYAEAYTRAGGLETQITNLTEQLAPIEISQPINNFTNETQDIASGVDTVCAKIETEAVRAADLFTKIDTLKKKIEVLKEEKLKMDTFCAEAEKQFAEFDRRNQADDADMRELTEQVQKLYLHKRPSRSTGPEQLLPTKIEDHLEHIRPFVVQRITDDLTRIFQNLVLRCRENQEKVAEEVTKMLQPVLDLTERVIQCSQPQTGS